MQNPKTGYGFFILYEKMIQVAIISNTLPKKELAKDTLMENIYFLPKVLMTELFADAGISLIRVAMEDYDTQKNVFLKYGIYTKNGFALYTKEVCPDILRNRSGGFALLSLLDIEKKYTVVPRVGISILSADKREQYLLCKQRQPKTILGNHADIDTLSDIFMTQLLVKPLTGTGGMGIKKFSVDDTDAISLYIDTLPTKALIQQFIDVSGGYPGWIEGVHDVRVVCIGGKPDHLTVRQPANGSYKSNISLGGSSRRLL